MSRTIYENGTILTMSGNDRTPACVEALLEEDGVIQAVGSRADIRALCDSQTHVEDLQGCTLLPGFIDPHSHLTSFAQSLGLVQLGDVTCFDELEHRIHDYVARVKPAPGKWVIGFGYDHNRFREHRHPDKKLLDEAAPSNPVIISHQSGHMGVMNSTALKLAGIDCDTKNPEGGMIGREPDGTPNGYLEENAFLTRSAIADKPSLHQQMDQITAAENEYLKYGITTVQDGLTRAPEWELLSEMARQRRLRLDTVSYIDIKQNPEVLRDNLDYQQYQNHLRIGGYKLFLDGSPQGRTAWITAPYLGNSPDNPDYRGYPAYTDEQVRYYMETAVGEQQQILVHCNGDAAAQQMIDAYARAKEKMFCGDLRPVMIHAQLLRRDQLAQLARLDMIASFFVAHTYYWGDTHIKNLGMERAAYISPAKSALDAGVLFTFHQDTPVLPPDMLDTVQRAALRTTRSGVVLGECERVSPEVALRAITANAAYQYFEETIKGSLEPGKKADLVLLGRNPLETPAEEIGCIPVLRTIKNGEALYTR